MTEATARAIVRHIGGRDDAEAVGLRAALRAGGFDPDTTEPDDPQGYNERACSTACAVNPAYLTTRELDAAIAAREEALGGMPF